MNDWNLNITYAPPFTSAQQYEILDINQTKNAQDFFVEGYTVLITEVKA